MATDSDRILQLTRIIDDLTSQSQRRRESRERARRSRNEWRNRLFAILTRLGVDVIPTFPWEITEQAIDRQLERSFTPLTPYLHQAIQEVLNETADGTAVDYGAERAVKKLRHAYDLARQR